MQSILKFISLCSIMHKFLNNLELFIIPSFKSTGIMEYVAFMAGENEFISDIVLATLSKRLRIRDVKQHDVYLHCRIKLNLIS